MRYINQFKLIHAITEHKDGWLNYKELLSTVNRQQIMKKLQKSNSGLKGISDFFITEEPIEDENWLKLPERDKKKIARLNAKIKKSKNLHSVISDLLKYKLKYPDVPPIYNYLGIAYNRADQQKEFYRILLETREKFPDYVFGKISMAEYYLSIDRHKKIPDILDHKFEITQHFPVGTEAFHISAVRGFYYVIGMYFIRAGKAELAYKSYFLLSDLDIDNPSTQILGHEIIGHEIKALKRSMDNYR